MVLKRRFGGWVVMVVLLCSSMAGAPVGADGPPDGDKVHVLTNADQQADHLGGYREFDCEPEVQLALLVTDYPGCGDFGGEHVLSGFGLIYMGFRSPDAGNVGPVPLTGTLQALLEWSQGEIELQCSWDEGELEECDWRIDDGWPRLGTEFTFSCQSLEGSLGNWGECFMGHQ